MPKDFRGNPATPATLDFVRFSRESFAAFHRRMADVIHELAPELPVHAKIMIFADFGNNATSYSVDPAAFAQLGAYNGNDAYVSYRGDQTRGDNTRGWVHDWWTMEAGYDYQRSAADKPIFNTENHIISDREKRFIPGRHVYAALWQNAVHGQSATTHWVWERAYDDGKSDFNGLILERPVCLAAWAHASLDLNRLADALAPIQNQEPTILLHRSLSSEILGRQGAFLSCYRAASFLGQPLGVVTEEMLAEYARTGVRARPLAAARVILLPRVTHLPDAARDGLKKLAAQGVKVLAGVRRLLPYTQRRRFPVSGRAVREAALAPVRRAGRGEEPAGLPARTRRRFREGRLRRGVARLPHERRLARDVHQPSGEVRARASGGARPRPPLRHRRAANP